MATKRNFTESDILFAVATFNADPYCVENDERVAEIMAEIDGISVMCTEHKESYYRIVKFLCNITNGKEIV